jgi:hypothetical protein
MPDYDESSAAQHAAEDAARAAGGQYRPRYNGWTNYETWSTNLWIINDQGTDEEARQTVAAAYHVAGRAVPPTSDPDPVSRAAGDHRYRISVAADALRDWWTEYTAEQAGALADDYSGPMSDAWTHFLGWVDWYEIAEGLAEE